MPGRNSHRASFYVWPACSVWLRGATPPKIQGIINSLPRRDAAGVCDQDSGHGPLSEAPTLRRVLCLVLCSTAAILRFFKIYLWTCILSVKSDGPMECACEKRRNTGSVCLLSPLPIPQDIRVPTSPRDPPGWDFSGTQWVTRCQACYLCVWVSRVLTAPRGYTFCLI